MGSDLPWPALHFVPTSALSPRGFVKSDPDRANATEPRLIPPGLTFGQATTHEVLIEIQAKAWRVR